MTPRRAGYWICAACTVVAIIGAFAGCLRAVRYRLTPEERHELCVEVGADAGRDAP